MQEKEEKIRKREKDIQHFQIELQRKNEEVKKITRESEKAVMLKDEEIHGLRRESES